MNAPQESPTEKLPPPVCQTDHVRIQFEALQRKPELASELSCFRQDGQLASIRYIAHPHGLHVARWLKLLAHTQAVVNIETANPVPAFSNGFVASRPLLPGFLKLPMPVRYLLAGLYLRLTGYRSSPGLIHAHCTSGNGFMAWLSGQPYMIGTYGTEIFGASQRGVVYCWVLKKILQGAERIADCSPECTAVLREQFGIPAERIYSFHLGYDEETFCPVEDATRLQLRHAAGLPVDEPIWVVNRRTHPHYRTREVVEGFLKYCQQNRRGRLAVLCGDYDSSYLREIYGLIESHPQGERITVVKPMLSPRELATWLQLSDFSISVPITDNFSISILESMGCGTIPILSNLSGYGELRSCQPVHWMNVFQPDDFAAMFTETAESWSKPHAASRNECVRFVQKAYSTEDAIRDMAAFYLGTPLRKGRSVRRVA